MFGLIAGCYRCDSPLCRSKNSYSRQPSDRPWFKKCGGCLLLTSIAVDLILVVGLITVASLALKGTVPLSKPLTYSAFGGAGAVITADIAVCCLAARR